jgi:hypothetical protein
MSDVNHPTALHRLLSEMEAMTQERIEAQKPEEKRARSEEEIGVLPEILRTMFALMSEKIAEKNLIANQHHDLHETEGEDEDKKTSDEHKRLHAEGASLSDDLEALRTLFWRSIREQFTIDPDANGIGVRADWKIVDMYNSTGGILGNIFEALAAIRK